MSYIDPTVADFQAYFNRDFPYGNSDLSTVQDVDITKALSQQQNTINSCLFANQNVYTQGALLLAAHYLVLNLRASSQGIAGKWDWVVASKGAAAVHATYKIPDRITQNPELSILCATVYGAQYVFMILPQLTGQMFSVQGGTVVPGGNYGLFGPPIGPWGGNDPGQ
jgi:hypothetical protein